ncbi:aminopeptidase N [Castellaniella sp. GW247-6E4]|uniref:aminopeptidase N n=1 Tax=Castellaniella sp. GW247-6E4 TaxID=3140380 RepID=UPI003315F0E1
MRTDSIQTIHRLDYTPYPYRLPEVSLEFDLDPERTLVRSTLRFEPAEGLEGHALELYGEDLELVSIMLDGRALSAGDYTLNDHTLTLRPPAGRSFTLVVTSACRPAANTSLMGLYVSGGKLFTQCEAQGFRRITWFPDRPDVMARYHVTLRAQPGPFPLLLSNGNLIAQRTLGDGRHQAIWEDPHPKPSYLFALVAGDFDCLERIETTRSGKPATLQVYSDRGCGEQTRWALDCLAHAMRWDEQRFGLELDLDRFMVVAARDFNMGAMENKGLNIFNAAYVMADPDTATDAAYRGIEAVIGHEYFHNWTGNRVTCRDWFQLSLKEGLTVFRDQEFSADMMALGLPDREAASARAVKRIDDVTTLRIAQFPEDAGPMAHPIRPDSYQEIANFYTATVYEKGAEVIRMQHTLLGEAGFRAGLDEYFRRHDGQAVTCDDFVDAMESVYRRLHPREDFSVFRRWYSQAGTPRVQVRIDHDATAQTCRITLSQRCDPVGLEARQAPAASKPPLHIPFAIGLLDPDGEPIRIEWEGELRDTLLLELREASRTWVLPGIARRPVVSLLRNFSAPVIIEAERPDAELALLARQDTDPFARWEAGQELARRHLLACVAAFQGGHPPPATDPLLETWRAALADTELTPAYQARLLALPSPKEILELTQPMDPQATVRAWTHMQRALGAGLAQTWRAVHDRNADDDGPYRPDPASAGRRSLRNLALAYLVAARAGDGRERALAQYRDARNMTERMGALTALLSQDDEDSAAKAILDDFHMRWRHDPLVVDRWFAVQATAPSCDVARVRALMAHPDFSLRNPNRARSLLFRYCMDNLKGLHTPAGYAFWAEQVLALDQINPEIAARLARGLDNWARYAPYAREAMREALRRVHGAPGLSRNVEEIVSKALNV